MFLRRSSSAPVRSAAAAVELAVLLPTILVPLMIGIWEVGRLLQVQQILENAAREGGRQASTTKYTNAQVEQAVRDYIQAAGLSVDPATVKCKNITGNGEEVYDAPAGHDCEITVQYPYKDVRYVISGMFVDEDMKMNAKATWRTVKDFPVTIPTDPPTEPLDEN